MSAKYSKGKTLQSMKTKKNEQISGTAATIFAAFLVASALGAIIMTENGMGDTAIGIYVTVTMLIGTYILFALKVASQCEKVVVIHPGKFKELAGAPTWNDHRVMVTPLSAEKTLNKDTVP